MKKSMTAPTRPALCTLAGAIAAALAFVATAASAQTAPPASLAAAGDKPESTLPAIKATATATSDSSLGYLGKDGSTGALGDRPVLDTPFSITVVDSQDILARGAKSIGQIFFNDPSVYTPSNSATTDWWGTQIRGLGVRNMYVDDIPVLLYWGGDFPTEAVDSVTALKGLTGFMYGFGEPGGALSYRLKRPTAASETSLVFGYRNPGLLSAHVDTSHRFGDGWGVRANLAVERGTAYNSAEIDRQVAALAVDKQFGATLKWHATVLHEDSKNTGEPFQLYFDSYVDAEGKLPKVTYEYDDINIDNSYYKTKTLLATTGVEWWFADDWRLGWQIGFTRKDHQSNKSFANLTNREGDYVGIMYNFAGRLENLFTQAMVQGTLATGAVKHELVGGLGLQRAADRWGRDWYWGAPDTGFDFTGNLYQEQAFRVTRTPDFTLEPRGPETRQAYAFVSDTLHFGERWEAIVGLRHTEFDMENGGYNTTATSPTLALVYKAGPKTRAYVSYVEGLEPGSRVGLDANPPYANAGEVLGATVSRQAEVGLKHDGDGFDYTVALFQIDRANQIDVWRDNQRYLTQDGRVTYRGIEATGAWRATRDVELGLGVIYLDASLDKLSPENAGLEGNTPANAPKWQVVGNTAYTVPGVKGLKLHGGWRYFGATWTNDANTLQVPGRHVLNAGFSYDFPLQGLAWTLHANVHNLLDEKYWASGGWGAGNVGEARNYSLSLVAQF
jgi:iron complex outermembrane receptor protein